MKRILVLRNAYAHANSRLDPCEKDLPRLRSPLGAGIGLKEDHGYLLVSKELAAVALEAVRKTLVPLIAAVKSKP